MVFGCSVNTTSFASGYSTNDSSTSTFVGWGVRKWLRAMGDCRKRIVRAGLGYRDDYSGFTAVMFAKTLARK